MEKGLLEFIKLLSENDNKNLSLQTVKLMEEAGELAKNVLPYEMASGSLHRFTSKQDILDNSIDVILVALSIAYKLGYQDAEIFDIMQKKSMYWAHLQKNEKRVDAFKIPHEIHITVKEVPDLTTFKEHCKQLEVKPIVLDLHTRQSTLVDVMTSSIYIGTTSQAYESLLVLKKKLQEFGYEVVRGKIEAAPWHPMVPTKENTFGHKENNYFESHIEVYLEEGSKHNLESLKELANELSVHVSNNFFKRTKEVSTVMLTYREYYGTLEFFKETLADIRSKLIERGFSISKKEIIEYTVFDSNVYHDIEWLKT